MVLKILKVMGCIIVVNGSILFADWALETRPPFGVAYFVDGVLMATIGLFGAVYYWIEKP